MKKLKLIASMLMIGLSITSCEKDKPTPSTNNTGSGSGISGCTSVQCSAIAVSTGNRCLNHTTNCSGLCHSHD